MMHTYMYTEFPMVPVVIGKPVEEGEVVGLFCYFDARVMLPAKMTDAPGSSYISMP